MVRLQTDFDFGQSEFDVHRGGKLVINELAVFWVLNSVVTLSIYIAEQSAIWRIKAKYLPWAAVDMLHSAGALDRPISWFPGSQLVYKVGNGYSHIRSSYTLCKGGMVWNMQSRHQLTCF